MLLSLLNNANNDMFIALGQLLMWQGVLVGLITYVFNNTIKWE